MPGIKSEIMNKTLPASQGLREFEVSDESGQEDENIQELEAKFAQRGIKLDPSTLQAMRAKQSMQPLTMDVEKDIAAARQEKANPKRGRLTAAAKKRVELLSGLKRNTRTCLIGEYEYQLQTLKGIEIREAIMMAVMYEGTVELSFETRKQLLARSITHVAGNEIGMFLGDDSLEARLEFIGDELDERITSRLYEEYLSLLNEVTEKYAIKTEEDAKKVADDLKK